jgi:hypothetical protein
MGGKNIRSAIRSDNEVSYQPEAPRARRMGADPRWATGDLLAWMIDSLDREARRMGLTRQSLVKLWLADKWARRLAKTTEEGEPSTDKT